MEKYISKLPDKVYKHELLSYLQEFQDMFGYIDLSFIEVLSKNSGIPSGKIFGITSFYNQFRFKPKGKFHIQVCEGSSCHVNAEIGLIEDIKKLIKADEKDTSNDGLYSLEIIPCMGACSQGPVISINGKFHTKVSKEDIKKIFSDLNL
ncbi:MAG: NAD(P)H-dependent oxidoreductase subunit E [Bacteroidales bacterium]|nr:NAD(P)H-dependent oxidoreductase subunit E [Bacteroidales bacterium]MDD4216153.1 NAD(P)H-dependent oxidoreductase subunit E [Bacteroidales bacterium]MDY0142719.1 NAD(P)H-dependent oxidoreductase subunit E [Bacteroidales bacterium]